MHNLTLVAFSEVTASESDSCCRRHFAAEIFLRLKCTGVSTVEIIYIWSLGLVSGLVIFLLEFFNFGICLFFPLATSKEKCVCSTVNECRLI